MIVALSPTAIPEPKENMSFVARTASSREARLFVLGWLQRRELVEFADRAALCVSELATNAALHTRRPFTIGVQGNASSVRIESVDSVPDRLPAVVPDRGSARDITQMSVTGRGLQIVAALSNRWGFRLATTMKSVWCEFDAGGRPAAPVLPEIHDERPTRMPSPDLVRLCFRNLPVRPAIASGLNVEDAIRTLQLAPGDAADGLSVEAVTLLTLVERSAPVRLAGRHAAMHAASRGETRFDVEFDATEEALRANGELAQLLHASPVAADVRAFREWVSAETRAQLRGAAPTHCPLAD